jgi:hypothetical protein
MEAFDPRALLLRAPGRGAQAYSAPLHRFVAPAECSRGLGRISHAARTALAFPAHRGAARHREERHAFAAPNGCNVGVCTIAGNEEPLEMSSLSNPRAPRSEFAVHGGSNRESRMLPWGADLLLESAAGGQGESRYGRIGIRHRLDRHHSFDGLQRNSVSLTRGERSRVPKRRATGHGRLETPTDGQSDRLQAPRRRGYECEAREGSQWGNKVRLQLDVTTLTLNRR